jgi:hypothetical protein
MTFSDGRTAAAVRLVFIAGLAAAVFAAVTGIGAAQSQAPSFTPRDEAPEEFPDAPGREDAFYACTACHGFKLVAQQGMSRARWNETLNLMAERHGMPKLEAKDREVVLGYLERAFPEAASGGRGFQNPFLKQ